jgi:hypothetical protein
MVEADLSQLKRQRVERCWRAALYYHQLIERAERASYGYPPEARAYLLKIAKGFEHEAREAEQALGVVAT